MHEIHLCDWLNWDINHWYAIRKSMTGGRVNKHVSHFQRDARHLNNWKLWKKISVSFCFSFICLPISGKVERCSLERVFLSIKNKITREKNARRKSKTPIRYISHRHYEAPLSSIFDVRSFSSFFPLILTTLVLKALVFDSFTFDRESETCVCP